jgi:hypothetical protein
MQKAMQTALVGLYAMVEDVAGSWILCANAKIRVTHAAADEVEMRSFMCFCIK